VLPEQSPGKLVLDTLPVLMLGSSMRLPPGSKPPPKSPRGSMRKCYGGTHSHCHQVYLLPFSHSCTSQSPLPQHYYHCTSYLRFSIPSVVSRLKFSKQCRECLLPRSSRKLVEILENLMQLQVDLPLLRHRESHQAAGQVGKPSGINEGDAVYVSEHSAKQCVRPRVRLLPSYPISIWQSMRSVMPPWPGIVFPKSCSHT
jgi:hypothetical protein